MSHPSLDGPAIVAGVRQCVAAALAQHVGWIEKPYLQDHRGATTVSTAGGARAWLALPSLTRTFGLRRCLYDMPNPAAEDQTPAEIGKTNILDQRQRIERQRD